MNIRFLETFVWVARLRSFRLAAERVHATQAAVSQRIAALESDLGVRLLDRDRREVQLTREGTFFLERAESIVQTYGETRRQVSAAKTLKPTVRLGVTDMVSMSFLPELYKLLIHEWAVETVDARIDLPISHYQALKNGEIDVAIGPVISQAPELVHVALCSFTMMWLASPALEVPDEPMSLASLARYPLISYSRASLPHRLIVEQLQAAGVRGVRLHTATSLAAVIQLVQAGCGISAVPPALVRPLLESGQLRILAIEEPFPEVQISVSYLHAPEDDTGRRLASVVKEAVKRHVRDSDQRFVHAS